MTVKFKVHPGGTLPTYGSAAAIGLDLFACIPPGFFFNIMPGERHVVQTAVSVEVPNGYYGRIAPRSGLAVKHGIDVMAGVIDPDYRGEIGVVLINHSNAIFSVYSGDRIAQLIFERAQRFEPLEVKELSNTERDGAGFGSTGTNG